jgi:pantetheine-phosphate adenylyltransferase
MAKHVLYPGSFDPVTLGHIDILERALGLFDRVTIVVAATGKAGWLSVDERLDLLRKSVAHLSGVEVHPFSGLLVDEVRSRGATAVIRGIRCAGDYEHEWSLAGVNSLLAEGIEYVFFLARPDLAVISSTLVRDVIRHGGSLARLVPAAAVGYLAQKGDL